MFLVLAFRSEHPFGLAYRVPLHDGSLAIGRGPKVMFQTGPGGHRLTLPDLGVSRRHAELRRDSGALRVTDLGSTNGVFIDGERVVQCTLRPGQILEVGSCFFVLLDGGTQGGNGVSITHSSTSDPALERSIARVAADLDPFALVGDLGLAAWAIAEDVHFCSRAAGALVAYEQGDLVPRVAAAQGGTLYIRDIESLPMTVVRQLLSTMKSPSRPRIVVGAANRRALDVLGSASTALARRMICIPPLARRRHDIGHLLSRALAEAVRGAGRSLGALRLSRSATRHLLGHDWPGGYDELVAATVIAVQAIRGETLEVHHLPMWFRRRSIVNVPATSRAARASP